MNDTAERLAGALERAGYRVRWPRNEKKWFNTSRVICDGSDELTLGFKNNDGDGRQFPLQLRCFSGCAASDISRALLAAVGWTSWRGDASPAPEIVPRPAKAVATKRRAVLAPAGNLPPRRELDVYARRQRNKDGRPWVQVADPIYHPYSEADGKTAICAVRFLLEGGKQMRPWTFDGIQWECEISPGLTALPLYGLSRVLEYPDAPVVVMEGEKAADAAPAVFKDAVGVCPYGGSQFESWPTDWAPLHDRQVFVIGDRDPQGTHFSRAVRDTTGIPSPVLVHPDKVWQQLGGLGIAPPGWDIADGVTECGCAASGLLDRAARMAAQAGNPKVTATMRAQRLQVMRQLVDAAFDASLVCQQPECHAERLARAATVIAQTSV